MKTTLFQIDSKERLRMWSIDVEKISNTQYDIVTEDGLVDGKKKGSRVPITEGKGGKTIEQQAIADAQTEINSKVKKGYVQNIDDVKKRGETATIKEPAKGHKYHPTGAQKGSKTLIQGKMADKTIGLERKLDGFRYRIKLGATPVFHSSSGDVVPSFPHIEERLIKIYLTDVKKYEGVILDGEMYNHEVRMKFGFNAIQTACGTRKHFDEDTLKLRSLLQFHLFDVCIDDLFLPQRKEFIEPFYDNKTIIKNELYVIKADEKVIETYFDKFLSEGYEGLMLKRLDVAYEYKKSNQWLKYKPEIDAEFQIVGFEKSITGDTLGALICVMEDGVTTFKADTKEELGTDIMKQRLWDIRNTLIGRWVTVTFLEYTSDGIPRHPKAKAFRKGESID